VTFLTRDQIERSLSSILARACDANIKVALAGGLAMQHYGSPRLTSDLDLLVDDDYSAELLDDVLEKRLSFGGRRGSVDDVEVDIIVREDRYNGLYQDALDAARPLNSVSRGERCLWVVRPEHLAVMKLAAGRPKDEDDLQYLLTAAIEGHIPFDVEHAQELADEYLGSFGGQSFQDAWQMTELLHELRDDPRAAALRKRMRSQR
jgi:hypothetical protein